MKILFLPLFMLFSFSLQDGVEKENLASSQDSILINRNYQLLFNFLKQDSLKTQKYWRQIDSGMVIVYIDLKEQNLRTLACDDTFRIVLETKISSGRVTPKGEFEILKKRKARTSVKYGGVMTYWNCITPNEAFGIHGLQDKSYEKHLGKPVSHGCIRISKAIEQEFYEIAVIGTKVVIN